MAKSSFASKQHRYVSRDKRINPKRRRRVKGHKPVKRKRCYKCAVPHLASEHESHGHGAHRRRKSKAAKSRGKRRVSRRGRRRDKRGRFV